MEKMRNKFETLAERKELFKTNKEGNKYIIKLNSSIN
jgi:hypothetical protein